MTAVGCDTVEVNPPQHSIKQREKCGLTPGTTPGQVGNAQFTLLDFKRMISAAAIDDNALVAEKNERNPTPQGNAPRL